MCINPLEASLKSSDVLKFREELLNQFFKKKIYSERNKWDSIIKIRRKGTFVFDDLAEGRQLTKKDIRSLDLTQTDFKELENKNILLFDDSIHTGKTIKGFIEKFPNSTITVASVLITKKALTSFRDKYKDIDLIKHLDLDEDQYDKYYYSYMTHYFDYMCLPQLSLPNDEFVFPGRIGRDEVKEYFAIGENEVEESQNWRVPIRYEDRFKMVLELNKNEVEEIVKDTSLKNIEISQSKIRFFVHNEVNPTKIYVEYVINPEDNLHECQNSLKYRYSSCTSKDCDICTACYISNFAFLLKCRIKEKLESLNIKSSDKPLIWYFNDCLVNPKNFKETEN